MTHHDDEPIPDSQLTLSGRGRSKTITRKTATASPKKPAAAAPIAPKAQRAAQAEAAPIAAESKARPHQPITRNPTTAPWTVIITRPQGDKFEIACWRETKANRLVEDARKAGAKAKLRVNHE